jgi:hypothetical protein
MGSLLRDGRCDGGLETGERQAAAQPVDPRGQAPALEATHAFGSLP